MSLYLIELKIKTAQVAANNISTVCNGSYDIDFTRRVCLENVAALHNILREIINRPKEDQPDEH